MAHGVAGELSFWGSLVTSEYPGAVQRLAPVWYSLGVARSSPVWWIQASNPAT